MSAADFPPTRDAAHQALADWLPRASRYAGRRNHVLPGHPHVSRLSPAIGCRLLLEEEVAAAALDRYAFSTVEKFVQEVYWRLYWKGWLEMRPSVWQDYRDGLSAIPKAGRAREVMEGRSGVAVMDAFARELVETGYLHNHARMWFAAFWIHTEGLPWELGADFFFRHLLDGDPASNTLSWRWVAGLHTRGKTYLARRSNVEKYVDPEWLADHREGLERLEQPRAAAVPERELDLTPVPLADEAPLESLDGRMGLWIHEGDLAVERSPLGERRFEAALASVPQEIWQTLGYSLGRQDYLTKAIEDGAHRAANHFGIQVPVVGGEGEPLVETIAAWAERESLDHVVALRPHVGPLGEVLPALRQTLQARGIGLVLRRRPIEAALFPAARRGFFGFWKRASRSLETAGAPSPQLELFS